ncbi:MAG: hypothetical protein ACI4B9_00640 [Eggerthellaceae bacterium]
MVQLREESKRSLSPDQVGTYIKVSKPSVWFLLALIAVLVAAGTVWFFAGSIAENVMGTAVADGESVVAYVSLEDSSRLSQGDAVFLESEDGKSVQGSVSAVMDTPVLAESIASGDDRDFLAQSFEGQRWVCAVELEAVLDPGIYNARIEVATHRPIRLLLGLD